MNKCFFILGAPESGKTTFGRELARLTGGICKDTSEAILQKYAELTGEAIKTRGDKAIHRPELVKIGNLITSRHPGRLVELIFDQVSSFKFPVSSSQFPVSSFTFPLIICGIRRRLEYAAGLRIARARGYAVRTILIERILNQKTDNFELADIDADFVVDNCSTLDFLHSRAAAIAASL